MPFALILSSSVAFGVKWTCVTLEVDPCHLPRSYLGPVAFCPAGHLLLIWSCIDSFGAYGFAPPPLFLPEVPNTCIGGSGAGTLEVLWLQTRHTFRHFLLASPFVCWTCELTQFACAPKSHIGGSGMTASHIAPSCHCDAEQLTSTMRGRRALSSVRFLGPLCSPHDLIFFGGLDLSSWGFVRAPKSHIGGSGMTAVQPPARPNAPRSSGQPLPSLATFEVTAGHEGRPPDQKGALELLLILGSTLVPFSRGIVVLVLLGLLRLLLWRRPTSSRISTILCAPLGGRCCDFALPLGNIARPEAVLDWSVDRKHHRKSQREQGRSIWKVLLGGICPILGFPSVPGPFFVSFPCACWLLSPTPAAGMAREGWPDDLPMRSTSVPVFTPVITAGVSDAWSPDHDPERGVRAEDSFLIHELPWSADLVDRCADPCLGCYIYTPHYHPVALAVRMPAHADLRYAMDVLTDCAPGVPQGLFNAMVPVHPQRVPGFLSVIRFPAHIRGVHEGYSAVICDLTRLGGSYFATVLPKSLSHQSLVEYLTPLVSDTEEPLRFYIGCRAKVWPEEALVTLRDGDAITVVRYPETTFLRHRAEGLQDRANWSPMSQFYAPDFRQATCVLHGEHRFCMDVPIPHGLDLFDQLVSELRLDASRIAICSFPLEDLEVHGTRCPLTVAVADVAAPTGGYREPHRQDFFVLCDLRPLGLKPRFVYAHLPRLHLPSLIADLGIALPAAFQVGITGARVTGDIVHISCNCTLLFYAQEAEAEDSVSIADLSPMPEPDHPGDALPSEELDPSVELASPSHLLDPTIPVGHGWNLGVTDIRDGTGPSSSAQTMTAPPAALIDPQPPPQHSASWSYASYCAHMAGAWEDLGEEDTQPEASLPPRSEPANICTRTHEASTPPAPEACPVHSHTASVSVDDSAVTLGFDHDTTALIVLIFAPDYGPEYIRARVRLPCGVEQLLEQVFADRYGPLARHFPKLFPAVPQPREGYLLFVSAPEWLTERPIVILDCQRILQTVTACLLYPVLTRESLLLAAGIRHDSDVSVFVHGLLQPLGPGQKVSLVTGMVVSFAQYGSGAPATFDLTSRLQSLEGWEQSPVLPGPGYLPGETLWVLTDGQPVRFHLGYRHRLCLQAELSSYVASDEHRLTVVAAQPGITNAFMKGYWITDVVVATERISPVPFPPARFRENGIVLILDCRPLLLGFRWLLLQRPDISTAEVTQLFHDQCPAEYLITVTGCEPTQSGTDMVFHVCSGQVLTISLVEDLQSSAPSVAPPDNPPDGRSDDSGLKRDGRGSGTPPSSGHGAFHHDATGDSSCSERQRSRSPRGNHQDDAQISPTLEDQGTQDHTGDPGAKQEPIRALSATAEAAVPSSSALTFTAARFRVVVPEALSVTLSALCQARSTLPLSLCLAGLQFSTDPDWREGHQDSASQSSIVVDFRVASAYEAARIAATRLGLPWPLLAPRSSSPAIQDVTEDSQDIPGNKTDIEATFLVLVPEYSPDSVTMSLAVPHTVADVLRQIDACRSSTGRRLFPVLHPVHPQPDVRWGLVVAAPPWLGTRVILCLDLTLIDGRIFSAVSPPDLDKHILLNMAGLSGGAAVEVYLGDCDEPAEYGAELSVSNGDCISFVPAREPLEVRCSLQAMLNAPFGWAGGPAFPQAPPGDRFCVVSEGLYFDFLICSDRGAFYRSDLAARLGIPINTLCLQPAAPRQSDVTLYGRQCRTVLCISSSPRRNDDEVALLDCRPILEGWSRVCTTNRWLDVGALRRSLSLAAPEGYTVELSGCPPHWNWLWLNPGQVVVVSYTTPDQVGVEESGDPLPDESADGDDPDRANEPDQAWKEDPGTWGLPKPATKTSDLSTHWTGWNAPSSTLSLLRDTLLDLGFSGISTPARETCLSSGVCLCLDLARILSRVVKWGFGFIEHAKPSGSHDLTSATLPGLDGDLLPESPSCKLLEEPIDSGSIPDHALQDARTAARALGVGWPFPPYQWTSHPPDEDDADRTSLSDHVDTVTDVVFYLLTPGFTGERISAPMALPQTVGDALDMIQTRRSRDRSEFFPVLVPVTPQLDLGWGVALAIPPWVQHRVIVCLDLSLFDNRIVPADVPAHADHHSLCESAGLAPETDVDIYLPGVEAPLPRGVDCHLWTGICIAFVIPGSRRPEAFDLDAMLRSHLGWEQNPTLPRDSLDNGYGVVGQRGQCLFRLHTDRARHYQSDVALLVGVHPDRIVLTPAQEQPMNVCVKGWDCRAVVAATDRQERYDWNEGRANARVGL